MVILNSKQFDEQGEGLFLNRMIISGIVKCVYRTENRSVGLMNQTKLHFNPIPHAVVITITTMVGRAVYQHLHRLEQRPLVAFSHGTAYVKLF